MATGVDESCCTGRCKLTYRSWLKTTLTPVNILCVSLKSNKLVECLHKTKRRFFLKILNRGLFTSMFTSSLLRHLRLCWCNSAFLGTLLPPVRNQSTGNLYRVAHMLAAHAWYKHSSKHRFSLLVQWLWRRTDLKYDMQTVESWVKFLVGFIPKTGKRSIPGEKVNLTWKGAGEEPSIWESGKGQAAKLTAPSNCYLSFCWSLGCVQSFMKFYTTHIRF